MPLMSGVRLGPYEIVGPLGSGGMGEVYRARDPRLGRDVAIKVLPAAFSADPERLQRFEQEARAASRRFRGRAASGRSRPLEATGRGGDVMARRFSIWLLITS